MAEGNNFYIMHIMSKVRFRWPRWYNNTGEEIWAALGHEKGQETVDTPEM